MSDTVVLAKEEVVVVKVQSAPKPMYMEDETVRVSNRVQMLLSKKFRNLTMKFVNDYNVLSDSDKIVLSNRIRMTRIMLTDRSVMFGK